MDGDLNTINKDHDAWCMYRKESGIVPVLERPVVVPSTTTGYITHGTQDGSTSLSVCPVSSGQFSLVVRPVVRQPIVVPTKQRSKLLKQIGTRLGDRGNPWFTV